MHNIKVTNILVLAAALLLQPILNPGSQALAKRKSPPKAYSFIAEGGKVSQAECDGERKLPRLKKLKEFSKTGSYMGSELQDPEIPGKANEEMWKHIFRDKGTCNSILAKAPSSVVEATAKGPKPELPPDDEDDEMRPSEASETEE
ncbi:MAG: hypothetical protein HUU57_06280 [Bdellovibrio sp.]|nr:hypothetical protein [Bdellovibrio sp.]